MAYPTDHIDTSGLTYYGREAQEIFAKDVYNLDLRGLGITFIDGVRGKRKIYMGDFQNVWKSYSCAFEPDGQVKLSEDYIEPVAIKVNKEFCRQEFMDSFLVEQTAMTLAGGMAVSFSEWYFTKLREQMSKEYVDLFWNGDTGYTGTAKPYLAITDGIVKKLTDASGATHITGSVMTVDNVLAQVEAAISAGLANAAANDTPTDGYKVLMNYADVQLLRMSLGKVCCPNNQSIFSNYAQTANGGIQIFGFDVVPTMIARNVIVFGPVKNLILGFDSYDAHLQYKIIYMMDTTLDDAYRVAAISNIATGILYPELFVISKP